MRIHFITLYDVTIQIVNALRCIFSHCFATLILHSRIMDDKQLIVGKDLVVLCSFVSN